MQRRTYRCLGRAETYRHIDIQEGAGQGGRRRGGQGGAGACAQEDILSHPQPSHESCWLPWTLDSCKVMLCSGGCRAGRAVQGEEKAAGELGTGRGVWVAC